MGKHHPAAFGAEVKLVETPACQAGDSGFDSRRFRMKWLRYRVHWAGGTHDWEYIPLCVNKLDEETKGRVQEKIEDVNDNHSWSDKYRRVEYEIINTRQVPNGRIERSHQHIIWGIEGARERIERLEKELAAVEKEMGKGRKTDPDEIEHAKRKAKMEAIIKKTQRERERERKREEKKKKKKTLA